MLICVYCGDVMESLTKEQIKIFGKPTCCDCNMIEIDEGRLHGIVRAMDTLKSNLEKEILKGVE